MKKNKYFITGMAVLLLSFGFDLTGCATNVASTKTPNWEIKSIPTAGHDYTILGTVTLEKN
ncbi:MAG: hypothetical protein LBD58_08960 [Treponema sp.]|jgi:hypothetical protein|nr:hypothetical protein [Treponema sp.]